MNLSISSIEGNRQWLDGGAMFGNAPRPLWQRWAQPDDLGRIPLACRCLLVETDDFKILCETGIGAFFQPDLAHRYGVENPEQHQLIDNLKTLGIEEGDIDYVILSHLHFDHAGGLLPTYEEMQNPSWTLHFPKAQYVVGQEAWDRAQNPHFRDRASFIPELIEKLATSDRLHLVQHCEPPAPLSGLLSFFESHGHTPGQLHSVFKGSQDSIVFCGDLIPGAAWTHLPITMGYDRFPEKLIEEKQELYQKMQATSWKAFFTHDPETACARIGKNEKGKFEAQEKFFQIVRESL